MTEQVNVSNESVGQNQNVNAVSAQPVQAKSYSDDDVNRIVGEKKQKAYEQGKQDALAEYQRQQQSSLQAHTTPTSIGGIPQLSAAQIEEIKKQLEPGLRESAKNDAVQALRNEQMVHQFALKMSAGAQKYADFEKTVTALNLPSIPQVVQLANGFENTPDIMYDLGKNPSKVSSLMVLASINPQLAFEEMQRLSDSIKNNETALANQPNIREPLSQIKSSNVGVGSGKLTSAERRQHPLYRV